MRLFAWGRRQRKPAGSECLGEKSRKHMHPGMMAWWKHAHRHGRGSCEPSCHAGYAEAGCHDPSDTPDDARHGRRHWGRHAEEAFASHGDDGEFGHFGVRRPLRFLAHKLDLEGAQVTKLAGILNELKTERAQAAVDHRRSTAAIADAMVGEAIDEAKLGAGVSERVKSSERLRDAVVRAIGQIHALLNPEQRERFAYLIRTGVLNI
jgi:Spy/CpxP family protein refolding chaperone